MARILVVDDEPDQRFLLRRIFERAGHEVTEATDGAAAVKAIRELPPDLVVTDMMMPIMGGAEFIQCLRDDPATAHIPILAASGENQAGALRGEGACGGEADAGAGAGDEGGLLCERLVCDFW